METGRLSIRPFKSDDWPDLYEYLSQEEVVRYEPYGVFTEKAARREALRRSRDSAFWAVCLKDGGKLIGNLYLAKQEFDTWELGFVFNQNYHGNGYATEAAFALIDDVFKNRRAHRVTALCNPLNAPSWKLLERLCMRREGHLLQNVYFKKDEAGRPLWVDTFEYGILSCEWQERGKNGTVPN
jgi:RimJ/RimL family protein N-acetyltransferase